MTKMQTGQTVNDRHYVIFTKITQYCYSLQQLMNTNKWCNYSPLCFIISLDEYVVLILMFANLHKYLHYVNLISVKMM